MTPLAIFAYNRPDHLNRLLESLFKCDGLEECAVYIYCDGSRGREDRENVHFVRKVAEEWKDRIRAEIIQRDVNLGLSKSIVTGVTDLCEKYGRVIVVEDDLVVNPVFVQYMVGALEKYQHENEVLQISAYQFPIGGVSGSECVFLPLATTWGWGTWKRAWKLFDWDATNALRELHNKELRKEFDLRDSYPYTKMLIDRINCKNDSWGILWHWSVFKSKGLILYPPTSLVWVGGWDGSGTHCGEKEIFDQPEQDEYQEKYLNDQLVFPDIVSANDKVFGRVIDCIKRSRRHGWFRAIQNRIAVLYRLVLSRRY